MNAIALLLLLLGMQFCACSGDGAGRAAVRPVAAEWVAPERVLVVYNRSDPNSAVVAGYYMHRRAIPERNLVGCDVTTDDEIPLSVYKLAVEAPVRERLASLAGNDSVDYIVLARGMPLSIREGGWSVDAFLSAMDMHLTPVRGRDVKALARLANPYFGRNEHFHRRAFGTFLVTRLDGYTVEDVMTLIDNSLNALPNRGPFLLDVDPSRDGDGYGAVNRAMRRAARALAQEGMEVTLSEGPKFKASPAPLAGYYSWGSNDVSYDPTVYKALRFLPGGIAETVVSTSARTFRPVAGGQSLIADLIAGGVTGVKGYVSEPLVSYVCPADILFDRYTAGYNLAESFYMATPLLLWKDVVVGDPLCAPYARP
jgi:uncharacterized protein (TIGR03790 family)